MSSSFEKRLSLINDVLSTVPPNSEICIDTTMKTFSNNIQLTKRIGSESVNAEAHLACFKKQKTDICQSLAVKLIPLHSKELEVMKKKDVKEAMTTSLSAEINVLRLCTFLVESGVCPNLPVLYKYSVCNSCRFENENLNKRFLVEYGRNTNVPCLIAVNEFAQYGDLKSWSKKPHSDLEWAVAFFQIYAGLYVLQKYFNLTHHDMHWGNVLVEENISQSSYQRYTIDGRDYFIPNIGYTFLLWDFGYVRIPDKIEISELNKYKYYARPDQNPRKCVDYMRITSAPLWAESEYKIPVSPIMEQFYAEIINAYNSETNFSALFPQIFSDFFVPPPPNTIIVDKYNFDQNLPNLPKEFVWLLTSPNYINQKRIIFDTTAPPNTPISEQTANVVKDIALNGSVDMMDLD